jgi:hypothetical protein
MTNFTIFCEIAKEEELLTPALLIPLETRDHTWSLIVIPSSLRKLLLK